MIIKLMLGGFTQNHRTTIKDVLNDDNDDNEKDDSDYDAIFIPENDGFFDFCHQLILEIYSTQIVKKIKTIHEERSENKLKNIL